MPLYVYKCNNCDHQFEVRQRYSEEPLTICNQCEGPVRRVINSVGVVFKGSGFYVTDSRNGKSGSLSNGSAKSDADDKSEKSEKKTEDGSAAAATTSKADKKASAGASATPAT
jgi:putative FmdB family regulatory protein